MLLNLYIKTTCLTWPETALFGSLCLELYTLYIKTTIWTLFVVSLLSKVIKPLVLNLASLDLGLKAYSTFYTVSDILLLVNNICSLKFTPQQELLNWLYSESLVITHTHEQRLATFDLLSHTFFYPGKLYKWSEYIHAIHCSPYNMEQMDESYEILSLMQHYICDNACRDVLSFEIFKLLLCYVSLANCKSNLVLNPADDWRYWNSVVREYILLILKLTLWREHATCVERPPVYKDHFSFVPRAVFIYKFDCTVVSQWHDQLFWAFCFEFLPLKLTRTMVACTTIIIMIVFCFHCISRWQHYSIPWWSAGYPHNDGSSSNLRTVQEPQLPGSSTQSPWRCRYGVVGQTITCYFKYLYR